MVKLVNAKEFAEMCGFPLFTIRRYCREGKIPCWNFKRRYLMDPDAAFAAMKELQYKPEKVLDNPVSVNKILARARAKVRKSSGSRVSSGSGLSYHEQIRNL